MVWLKEKQEAKTTENPNTKEKPRKKWKVYGEEQSMQKYAIFFKSLHT